MRILILMYHMISKTDHPNEKRYALPPEKFKKQMWYLKYKGYTPISLDDLYEYFFNKTNTTPTVCHSEERRDKESRFDIMGKCRSKTTNGLPKKPVVITFDDGYMDNYEYALPILSEYKLPATVFIISNLVEGKNIWAIREGYPERPLMGWREIEEMKRFGITFGSHTVNHPRLSHLSPEDSKKEIEYSKKSIEDRLGAPVNHFAYPYGDMNKLVVNMVQEACYKTACSIRPGFNSEKINPFELRRIEVNGTDSLWQFAIKLAYGTNDGNLLLPARYYMKRISEKLSLKLDEAITK